MVLKRNLKSVVFNVFCHGSPRITQPEQWDRQAFLSGYFAGFLFDLKLDFTIELT